MFFKYVNATEELRLAVAELSSISVAYVSLSEELNPSKAVILEVAELEYIVILPVISDAICEEPDRSVGLFTRV